MSVADLWSHEPRSSRWLGLFMARVLWNTDVVGAQNVPSEGPVLLAANHTGVVDGPILHGVAPRHAHLMVKEEVFRGPLGWALRGAGQIPVDRTGGRAALTSALAMLKDGKVVGVFPEGNRGRGDATNARAGIAWLALNGGAPVVPVAMLGTRRTGESVNHIPGLRRPLAVEFGRPIVIERTPGTSGKAALLEANETIRLALADLVASAVARTGQGLPTDDPNRERTA